MSGKEWRYHCSGNGPHALLCLSGSLGASEGTASLISELLPGARIVMPEYTPVETMAEVLAGLDHIVKEEGLQSVTVYGGSFGGLIAQCWARLHPERVTHLILSGTAPPDPSRVSGNQKALRRLPCVPMVAIRFLLRMTLRILLRKAKLPRWKEEYLQLISRLTKDDLASRYQIAMDLDSNYKYTSLDLPPCMRILILEGDRDRVAHTAVRDQLRALYPHAQTHVFRGAGHSAMMTHTKEWSDAVMEFLDFREQS